jgi:uncharacterized SAM-binding protein YcdF (DUF218 family)
MLFVLSKLLPVPLYPAGFSITLMAAALVMLALRRCQSAMILCALSAATLLLCSLPITAHLALRSLEKRFDQKATYPRVSAIALLGGATHPASPPRRYAEVSAAGDRVIHAARLFKQGYAPWVIPTGGAIGFYGAIIPEARSMSELLSGPLGIDSAHIIREEQSRNTRDHAIYIGRILDSLNLPRDILVVTSASHMPRAMGVFRKAGFNAVPAPADYETQRRLLLRLPQFLPSAEALLDVTRVLHEYYGLLAYRILGWI